MRFLTTEQPDSAHDVLSSAGVRHGNIDEIDLVVATFSFNQFEQRVAFCPATARWRKTVRWASKREQRKRIVGEVVFVNERQVLRGTGGLDGFLHMRGRVTTNTRVEIFAFPETIQVLKVEEDDAILRTSVGRLLSERLLSLSV